MEVGPSTRDARAEAITAGLLELGKADETPPPSPEPAAVKDEAPEPEPEAPAPAEGTPAPEQPLKLTDKSLVEDPADGKVKPWGEIKAERLRRADYDRKRGAEAERVRQLEAQERQRQADYEAWKAEQAAAASGEPEQRVAAIEARVNAVLTAQQAQAEQLEAERMAVAQERLDATLARVVSEHKLPAQYADRIGRETYARMQCGEAVTIETVAKEYADEREALREEARRDAVKQYKDKHRVGAPSGEGSRPAAPEADKIPQPGTREHQDWMRRQVAAL